MTTRVFLAAIALCALIAGGCGDDGKPQSSTGTATTTARSDSAAELKEAVRRAIEIDHRLSGQVLWTNRVPAHPPATAGPSLTNLRRSAAERRKQHIRVRVVKDTFRILSIDLDPSYARATARVLNTSRVIPHRGNGRVRGKPVQLHEHVRLELRRVADSSHFVVWEVTLLK